MSSSWAIIAIDVVVLLVTTMIDDVDVLIVGHYEEIRCQIYFYQDRLHQHEAIKIAILFSVFLCSLKRMKSFIDLQVKWSLSGLIDGHSVCLGHCRFSEKTDIQKQNNTLNKHYPSTIAISFLFLTNQSIQAV